TPGKGVPVVDRVAPEHRDRQRLAALRDVLDRAGELGNTGYLPALREESGYLEVRAHPLVEPAKDLEEHRLADEPKRALRAEPPAPRLDRRVFRARRELEARRRDLPRAAAEMPAPRDRLQERPAGLGVGERVEEDTVDHIVLGVDTELGDDRLGRAGADG